jgi:hypothetical protein
MYTINMKVEDEVREGPKGQGSLSTKKSTVLRHRIIRDLKNVKRRFLDVPKYEINTT